MIQIKNEESEITTLPSMNVVNDVPLVIMAYDNATIAQMPVKPRIFKSLGARDGLKTPWIFAKSSFRLYKPDN
jgi:hypothetical protein